MSFNWIAFRRNWVLDENRRREEFRNARRRTVYVFEAKGLLGRGITAQGFWPKGSLETHLPLPHLDHWQNFRLGLISGTKLPRIMAWTLDEAVREEELTGVPFPMGPELDEHDETFIIDGLIDSDFVWEYRAQCLIAEVLTEFLGVPVKPEDVLIEKAVAG
jgi:hypothetical protein